MVGRSGAVKFSEYRGLNQFGPAYRIMFENDPHAPGTVDRVLMENMVRLCLETESFLYSRYTPTRSLYRKGMRPRLEQYVKAIVSDCRSDEERVEAITRFTSGLQDKANEDFESMLIGGTEEEIIARGSDWCPDVARVGCALHQVAGFSARIVYLVDTGKAYSGHVITEVYRAKAWGAVDPLTNVVYRYPEGKPASTWDLMNNHGLIERHWRGESTPYTTVGQFRRAAVSNYFVWRWKDYSYAVSKINEYYRSILEMSSKGWPGGLRWLHGEDKRLSVP